MDHTMVLSYDYSSWNWNRWWRQTNVPPLWAISMAMAVCRCNMERITQCSMTRASSEATERRHWATIHSVSPCRPPWRQSTQQRCKMYPLCWPYPWSSRCGGTIARISRWWRFLAFIKATKPRHHRAITYSDMTNRTRLPLILGVYFIVKSLKKNLSCPTNNRVVTHQNDEKHLNNMSESFFGGG